MSRRPKGTPTLDLERATLAAALMLAEPNLPASTIASLTGGRRQVVLRFVRDARAAASRFPKPLRGTEEVGA